MVNNKTFNSLLILILLLSSCGSKDTPVDYGKSIFQANKKMFYSTKEYLEDNYIGNESSNARVVFVNINFNNNSKSIVYDSFIKGVLESNPLIKEIRLEKGLCEKKEFSEIIFYLNESYEYCTVAIVYDKCSEGFTSYESNNIQTLSLEDKWEVFCDN